MGKFRLRGNGDRSLMKKILEGVVVMVRSNGNRSFITLHRPLETFI